MGTLKKIGLAIVKGTAIAAEIAQMPFVAEILTSFIPGRPGQIVQTGISDLNAVAKILAITEAGSAAVNDPAAKTGSDKLNRAAPSVQQILLTWATSNLPGHNKVKDSAKVAEGARQVTSGLALFMEGLGD